MTTPFQNYLREKQAFDIGSISHMMQMAPDMLQHAGHMAGGLGDIASHVGHQAGNLAGHVAEHIPRNPAQAFHNAQGAVSHAWHNPASTALQIGAGHVAANAVIKGRSMLTKAPTNNVMNGMLHAGQGKIRGGFKHEMQTLLGGPEVAGGEYGIGHDLMRKALAHPSVNGDFAKARTYMQSMVNHPEAHKRLGGNHITKNLRDAVNALPEDGGSRPLKGVMDYKPDSMMFKARQGLGKTLARGTYFGGALATGNIDAVGFGLWNKGKERFAESTLGKAFTVDSITSPATKGRDGKLMRAINTFGVSPGYQDMRDLGASMHSLAKDKLTPENFKDYQGRMGKLTFKDPSTMLEVGDAMKTWGQKNKSTAGDREMWGRVGGFVDALEPNTRAKLQSAGRKGVDGVIDFAKTHETKLKEVGNKAYGGAAAEVNAQRAAGTKIKDLDFGQVGDAAIDGAAPGIRRGLGVVAGLGAGGLGVGGAYAGYRRYAKAQAPGADSGDFLRKSLTLGAGVAGAGAIGYGATAGIKALTRDDREDKTPSPFENFQQQKAAADDSVGILGNQLGRRFEQVPQPLPIRTGVPNHPKA